MSRERDGTQDWMEEITWSAGGLVSAIVQDAMTGRVLMSACMNREALAITVESGEAHYWSRSRQRLWRKGEESGHVQKVRELRLDCDGDAILLSVEQQGGITCHTGRERCFFRRYENGRWVVTDPVLKRPDEIYSKGSNASGRRK
ncbi:MAG TPA: phosphoribosyl-AMP cyclohydrolase [Terriglobales bacterium]|nr:phosphoribosyl-AMP cyclohydrolase [Terriglobales bacterium]